MSFNALVIGNESNANDVASVQTLALEKLPKGNVLVAVEYSTVNYKDALCMQADSSLVASYPHVPGIDFAGTVEHSEDSRYQPGDKVILTGWHVGEKHWGGLAQKARVDANWLVPLPEGLTTRQAMAIGTAGFAAGLAVIALEDHGLTPQQGEVLVTGAAGGVGSIAIAMLSKFGYDVVAVTGRPELAGYLTSLGATRLVNRNEVNTVSNKPLEKAVWAGCIDTVGGEMLARSLGQMKYGATVAAVGLAGGSQVPASVIPFLLRAINLIGIGTALYPAEKRPAAWQRIVDGLSLDKLDAMTRPATLAEVPALAADILQGKIKGRIVVDVNA